MPYIVVFAVIGIVFLQLSGAIPASSVGGPLVIAAAVFIAVLALAVHDAWTRKRGVLGWIVNIVVVLLGAFVAAQFGETIVIGSLALLRPLVQVEGSLAATGGPLLAFSLIAMMTVTLLGSWGALWVVNRWR